MKKIFIGCVVFFLILLIIFIILIYFVNKKIREFDKIKVSLLKSYYNTNKSFEFIKPQDEILDEARLKLYIEIHQEIQKKISENKSSFEKIKSPFKILSAMLKTLEGIGNTHIELLKQKQMSLEEYQWIARNVFAVIMKEKDSDNKDLKLLAETFEEQKNKMQEGMKNAKQKDSKFGFSTDFNDISNMKVPEKNVEIIKQYSKQLKESIDTFMLDMILVQFKELQSEDMEKTIKELKTAAMSFPRNLSLQVVSRDLYETVKFFYHNDTTNTTIF